MTDSLSEAKYIFEQEIKGEGGVCPCCMRKGKIHRYRIHKTEAAALRWMQVNSGVNRWVDVQKFAPRWMLRSKTYSILKHWDLIESRSKRSGLWRVTLRGIDFINGIIDIPEGVFVFNDTVYGYEKQRIYFRQCFDVAFDFAEFMSARFNWAAIAQEGP